MRKQLLLIPFFITTILSTLFSQFKTNLKNHISVSYEDSLSGFDIEEYNRLAKTNNYTEYEYHLNLPKFKRDFIKKKYGLYSYPAIAQQFNAKNSYNPPSPLVAPCVNEDFETGTFTGWTITEGSNSNSCTQAGCCPNNSNTWSQIVYYSISRCKMALFQVQFLTHH
ncbi:MAG: hypothetical protein KatS3mg027_0573 [Bacteroidia bacterium]|nr:MAG: hypothetical protein KatS3mg027_0573 [Bacteroidia bacterium]